jgi:tricorn protease
LAYVWLPNTGKAATNFNRYYFAQRTKGAIIDERFNHGGTIADYITDVLSRDLLGY